MSAATGANQEIEWNGTHYNSDECMQGSTLNESNEVFTYYCGGIQHEADGAETSTATLSFVLAVDDTEKVNAFKKGQSGNLIMYPGGKEAGYMRRSCTAKISNVTFGNPASGLLTMDVNYKVTSKVTHDAVPAA